MTGPGEKTTAQKMRENLAYLRSKGASRERIQQEIDRWKAELDAESRSERKLSGAEKLAGFASKVGSGATFGLLDEAVGLVSPDTKAEQRFLQKEYADQEPALAFGAEVLGGLAVPGSFLKAAPKAASFAKKAGTAVGEGLIQGGLSGAGNAEGSIEDRIAGAVSGGATGGAAAGALSGVIRGAGAARRAVAKRRGVDTPTLDELVLAQPQTDIDLAKQRFAELEKRGLGSEAMVADVLPQGEGALRSQATASKATRKNVDAELRQRANRLANLSDDRLSARAGVGRVSDERALADRLKKAQEEAGPLYEQARQEAAAFDMTNAPPDFTTPVVLQRPRIAAAVKRVIRDDPERFAGDVFSDPKLSHDVFDQAYKDMGEDIRYLQAKVKAKTATASERRSVRRMIRDREHLKKAISVRSETYPKALDKYAGEIAHRDAFALGAKDSPADVIPDEMASLDPATVKDYKTAKAGTLRANTPNVDLGEFARFQDVVAPVATREKAAVFKAAFGEDAYREYLGDVVEMAKLQRMRAGAGESSTVDKLIEQMQGNPDLMEVAKELASGNVMGAANRGLFMAGMDNLLASQKRADANAQFLMRRGADVPRTLEEMVGLRQKANEWGPRDWTRVNPSAAAARTGGAMSGRRYRSP